MTDFLGSLIVGIFKYFWVVLFIMLAVIIVLAIVVGSIQKHKMVKKEREKKSTLLEMSFEDDKKHAVARHIDGDTPEGKKYCPSCHSLTDAKSTTCNSCGYVFKEEEKNEKADY